MGSWCCQQAAIRPALDTPRPPSSSLKQLHETRAAPATEQGQYARGSPSERIEDKAEASPQSKADTDPGKEEEESKESIEENNGKEFVEVKEGECEENASAAVEELLRKMDIELAVRAPKLVNTEIGSQPSLVIPPARKQPWEHRKIYSPKHDLS